MNGYPPIKCPLCSEGIIYFMGVTDNTNHVAYCDKCGSFFNQEQIEVIKSKEPK